MDTPHPTIGIDASRAFVEERTGTENYSYQLIKNTAKASEGYNIRLYLRPGQNIESFRKYEITQKEIQRKNLWTQWGLARETWVSPPDLLFIPAHVVPFLKNPSVTTVVTVHDIRTEFLPQHSDWRQKLYLNSITERLRAFLTDHIIAVSEATKTDLIKRLGVSPEKITVIYEGVNRKRFNPAINKDEEKIKNVLDKYRVKRPYILFVGTIQPRKNLVRLIKAFNLLLDEKDELSLVLGGKRGWLAGEIYRTPSQLGIEDKVIFTDYIDDEDLPYLYAGAEVFTLPSLYEGFGLPILEALSLYTPVVTSNVSSMPEVGGELALYVDPYDVESIQQGLKSALTFSLEKEEVDLHLGKFKWSNVANQTVELFDRLI